MQRRNWQRQNQHHVDRYFTGVRTYMPTRLLTTRWIALSFRWAHGQVNWDRKLFITVHVAQRDRLLPTAIMATGAFSRKKTLPCTLWGCGNGMAMALFLTTDEKAIGVYCQRCCLFGDPSAVQTSGPTMWRAPRTTSKWRSNHERKRNRTFIQVDAIITFGRCRRCNVLMASTKDNRDRSDLLTKVFASDHNHIGMTLAIMNLALRRHREHVGNGNRRDGNFLAPVAMQARFDPVLQDLLQTPARTAG